MSSTQFAVRPSDDSRAAVIDTGGEITSASEAQLGEAYQRAADSGAKTIVLDFSDLGYMNSGGIGLLVTLLVRAQRQGRRLVALGLNEHYREIFALTRLDEAITIYDSEAAALAAVG